MATSFKLFKRVSVGFDYDSHRSFEAESQERGIDMSTLILNYAFMGREGVTFEEHKANSLRKEFEQQAKARQQQVRSE